MLFLIKSIFFFNKKLRLGATGKERNGALNYFFKQIIDICMPTHFKYLLWSASSGLDVFDPKI
jgi:hypothetical protein